MGSECSVLVMAAGAGTRMRSEIPKVLHPLCGRSLLGHALTAANGLDPAQVITVVRFERDQVAAEAQRTLPEVIIADQDDVPGTGRAVWCGLDQAQRAGHQLADTTIVTSGDVPLLQTETLRELLVAHESAGAAVTAVSMIAPEPGSYGRMIRTPDGQALARIVEAKDATPEELAVQEVNAGIYAFDTEFLLQALGGVGTDNAQGEVYLTDVVELARRDGRQAMAFVLEDTAQAEGCNDLVQLAGLREILNRRLQERHLRAGARIVDPATTTVDVQAQIEPDALILPGTALLGNTRVASGAKVGPQTTLISADIAAGSSVPHSFIDHAVVSATEQLAPFTHRVGDTY